MMLSLIGKSEADPGFLNGGRGGGGGGGGAYYKTVVY